MRFWLVVLLMAGLAGRASAGTTTAFASNDPGVRATAMGGAYTGLGGDPGALYWNPASISGLPSSSIDFGVENVDLLMRNNYFLQSAQVKIVHGPGRRPTSISRWRSAGRHTSIVSSIITSSSVRTSRGSSQASSADPIHVSRRTRVAAVIAACSALSDCGFTEHHRDYRVSSFEDLESKLDDATSEIGCVFAKLINDR
jgi:hypothetical protein